MTWPNNDEDWLREQLARGRDHVTDQDINQDGDVVRQDVNKALTPKHNPKNFVRSRKKSRKNKRRRRR